MFIIKLQFEIFIAFFRSGILGFGGGPSTIPLVHKEVVEHFKWMNDEEFSNVLALGNSLPGPIATKMAGYIGFKIGGVLGLINALTATIMPTVIIMIFLIGTLSNYRDSDYVQGMTSAITPVITVMMFVLTYQFLFSSKKSLGGLTTLFLLIISFIAYVILNIHPAIIILVIIIYSFIKYRK